MSVLLPNIYNLRMLRELAWAQVDHAPSASDEGTFRMTQWVNRALQRMYVDAPWLGQDDDVVLIVNEDATPASDTDLLVSESDEWVLRTQLTTTDPLGTSWPTDDSWSGRVLSIENPDLPGTWHDFRIREVWTAGVGNIYHYISLDRPWTHSTLTNLNWRVLTSEFVLPPDTLEVKAARVTQDGYDLPLTVMGVDGYERLTGSRRQGTEYTGTPTWITRRQPNQLRAPNFTPVPTVSQSGWVGPEPQGTFEYCITYVWGRQESESYHRPGPPTQSGGTSNATRSQPYLESGPSPVSVTATTTGGDITLTLPDVPHMLGFNNAATSRFHHTGIRIRIYRRRLTDASGTLDLSERFELLDEVENDTSYVDDGSITPDHFTPLQSRPRFETVGLWPYPDKRYTITLQLNKRGPDLVADTDTPLIPHDAIDALVVATLMYYYEASGNSSMLQVSMNRYYELLAGLQKRHGSLRSSSRPTRRRLHRPGTRYRGAWPRVPLQSDF